MTMNTLNHCITFLLLMMAFVIFGMMLIVVVEVVDERVGNWLRDRHKDKDDSRSDK